MAAFILANPYLLSAWTSKASPVSLRNEATLPTQWPRTAWVMMSMGGMRGGPSFGKNFGGGSGRRGVGKGPEGGGVGGSGGGVGGAGGDGTFSAADGAGNPLERACAWYLGYLRAKPVWTKVLTSLVGFAVADILVQSAREPKEASTGAEGEKAEGTVEKAMKGLRVFSYSDVVLWGVVQTAIFGAIFHGLCGHYYYNRLEQFLPGTKLTQVLGKTALDTILWPPYLISARAVYDALLSFSDERIKAVWNDAKNSKLGSEMILWLLLSLANFKFVETPQRILLHNGALVTFCGINKLFGLKALP